MPAASETQLVSKLIEKTQQNQVDWQPTGFAGQLTAAFADKYVILLTGGRLLGGLSTTLKVKNADGDELVSLDTLQEPRLSSLYDLAEQFVRKEIDDQLADLMKELDKPSPAKTREEMERQIDELMRGRGKK